MIHKVGHTCCTLNKLNKTKQNNSKKEKIKKESEYDVLISKSFESEKVKESLYDFIKMRSAIKKPLTTKGLELLIKKLNNLSVNEDEQILILNNSIMNNWQGIFAIKKSAEEEFLNG